MVELELTEVNDKNKAALRNLEMLLASSKDTESDLLQRLDSMAKDNDDLVLKVSFWIFLKLRHCEKATKFEKISLLF